MLLTHNGTCGSVADLQQKLRFAPHPPVRVRDSSISESKPLHTSPSQRTKRTGYMYRESSKKERLKLRLWVHLKFLYPAARSHYVGFLTQSKR